jgi:hypothetical protein
MKRNRVHLLLLCLVVAFAAMTFVGTASAGWTWDASTTGWTWDGPGANAADAPPG